MSLLLRDELRIALSPERVTLLRFGRGLRSRLISRQEIACEPVQAGETPWSKALDGMETGLRTMNGRPMDARVILSNNFVRYALLPWSDQISDAAEEQAFIRHCFAQTYGEEVQNWVLRASSAGYGEAQVASAIDQSLVERLDRIAASRRVKVISLQPYLMSVFNRWRPQLTGTSIWFVVAEPGRLCLSMLKQGCWSSLQSVKVGEDWPEALRNLLERELLVSESGGERGTVYLFAPGHDHKPDLPGWTVFGLSAKPGNGASPDIQFTQREQ